MSLNNLDKKLQRINSKNFYEQGTLHLCIESAELERDTSTWLRNMDPYVQFEYNGIKFQTTTSTSRGSMAKWNQIFEIYVHSL